MDLQSRLTEDMKSAMKSGQKDRLQVIRMLLSDVKNIDLMPNKPTAEQAVEAYGKTYSIDTVGAPIEGKSGTSDDAAKVVGGAAAGAILGKVIGGSGSDAAKGAAAGAAAGTAASLLTRGPDPVVKAGQTLTVSIDRSVTVRVRA